MATKKQVNAFIKTLSALAIAECEKRNKKICPSVCIAQAALETGWGTSPIMTRANAYFGIKADRSWIKAGKKVYNTKTREVYGGKSVSIVDCFRAYSSLEESVADYYDLITKNTRYAKAVNEPDYTKAITAIKNGGYATDPNYIASIVNIIKSNKLDKYDKVMTVKPKQTTKPVEKKETVKPKENKNKLKTIKNTVTADTLNIRAAASVSSKIVGTLKKGNTVTIDKINGIWAHAVGKGWISLNYIDSTVAVVKEDIANVRKFARKDSDLIKTLKKGAKVKIYYVTNNWYYTNEGGFIYYNKF